MGLERIRKFNKAFLTRLSCFSSVHLLLTYQLSSVSTQLVYWPTIIFLPHKRLHMTYLILSEAPKVRGPLLHVQTVLTGGTVVCISAT